MAKKLAAKKKAVEEVVEEVKDDGIEVKVVTEKPKKEEPMADKKEMKAEEPTFKIISMNGKLMRSYSNGKLGAALTEDYKA